MDQQRDIWDEIELESPTETLDDEMFPLVSAYADGECSPTERRLVEAYLAESAAGRESLAALRLQSAALDESKSDPPGWLAGAILAKTTRRPTWRDRLPGIGRVAAIGATAAAAGWATLGLWQVPATEIAEPTLVASSPEAAADVPNPITPLHVADDVDLSSPSPQERSPRPMQTKMIPAVHVPGTLGRTTPPNDSGAGVPAGGAGAGTDSPPSTAEYVAQNRAAPEQPDVVAMTSETYADEQHAASPPPTSHEPDPREKLRERLKALNQTGSDLKQPIKGGK